MPFLKSFVRVTQGIATLAVIAALLTACVSPPTKPQREVLLGGLFSLTGNWSTQGQTGRVAMELAIEDVNRYLAGNAAGVHFAAAIEDTRLEAGDRRYGDFDFWAVRVENSAPR